MIDTRRRLIAFSAIFALGFVLGGWVLPRTSARAQTATRLFELRTYTTHEGKLPNLNARFRDHTMRLFEKHGMTNIGYWNPVDAPASENTLVYIIAHPDRESAEQSWKAFREDPEWQKAKEKSEADGRIVSKVESIFIESTDYSPLK